jgi:hypothetical protein
VLHVQSSVASSDLVYLYNSGSTASDVLRLNTEGIGSGTLIFDAQSAGSSRFVITGEGRVGIGTTAPGSMLHVAGAVLGESYGINAIALASSVGNGIFAPSGNTLGFTTGATERARIDSSGRLLVGTSTARATYYGAGVSAGINVESAGNLAASNRSISAVNGNADSTDGDAILYLGRTRSNTLGGTTIVQNGDFIGRVAFVGSDGTNMYAAAHIRAEVDGTPGTGDMPGRLVFSTTADGTASPTERMRITSAGLVGIGTASPNFALDVRSGDIGIKRSATDDGALYFGVGVNNYIYGTSTNNLLAFATNGSERARIDSNGKFLVGTSTSRGAFFNTGSGYDHQIQVESAFAASFVRNDATASGVYITLGKTRSASAGGITAVNSGDDLGNISFQGSDGSELVEAARIAVSVDGTPGANDMPGKIVLATTLDGASSPTEALRITNDRVICYNQPAPATYAAATTLTIADLKTAIITYTGAAATLTLPTGTLAEGGFSSIYTNMTFEWSVINTGSGTCTIGAGTAHTIVGGATIAAGASGRFASRRTAANTFVSYRLS